MGFRLIDSLNITDKPTYGKAVSFALQTSLANQSGLFVVIVLTLCIVFLFGMNKKASNA